MSQFDYDKMRMPETQWLPKPPDPSPFLRAVEQEYRKATFSLQWDMGCQLWGPSYVPVNRVDSSRWFAPWWPYRAAQSLHKARRELDRRLSDAWASLRGETFDLDD